MTIYDDMRGYVHTHDRNGWFDVATETTPMYQMVDKADAENAKLRELCKSAHACKVNEGCCEDCYADEGECPVEREMRDLGIEVTDAGA